MGAQRKVWFLTGTSSGFGRLVAEEVLARGESVVATARDPKALDDLVASAPARVHAVRLDVTNAKEIDDAVASAHERFGAEYEATVGPTRAYAARSDGVQAGDPAKAAIAIVDAVAAGAPTLRLPLGADAVQSIREKLGRVTADVNRTEAVASSTSHE